MNFSDMVNQCATDRCGKDGCSVDFGRGVPDSVTIIDCDHTLLPFDDRKRPDYFVLEMESSETARVVVLELTKGPPKIHYAVEQIQSGADCLQSMTGRPARVKLLPVHLHGRKRVHRNDLAYLKSDSGRIRFGKQVFTVVLRPCSSKWSEVRRGVE